MINELSIEEFVEMMMDMREKIDPFELLKYEYQEAKNSIRNKESVHWKEMLAVLSFAMNYPAKHLSAEDMLRLKKVLMPLISIVIAFVPQSSCEEMIALHDAGCLDLVSVDEESKVEVDADGKIIYHFSDETLNKKIEYKTFVDCIGQKHLSLEACPFESLLAAGTVSAARLKFRSPEQGKEMYQRDEENVETGANDDFFLKVPGIAITDNFRVVEKSGYENPRIYVMAVPFIGGFNPDYSGLDFCEAASDNIVKDIFQHEE